VQFLPMMDDDGSLKKHAMWQWVMSSSATRTTKIHAINQKSCHLEHQYLVGWHDNFLLFIVAQLFLMVDNTAERSLL
jgi:hypothetical protein